MPSELPAKLESSIQIGDLINNLIWVSSTIYFFKYLYNKLGDNWAAKTILRASK